MARIIALALIGASPWAWACTPLLPGGKDYKTTVSGGNGKYRAEGLMFHMPGRWEYIFEVRAAGASERLTTSVVLQ